MYTLLGRFLHLASPSPIYHIYCILHFGQITTMQKYFNSGINEAAMTSWHETLEIISHHLADAPAVLDPKRNVWNMLVV